MEHARARLAARIPFAITLMLGTSVAFLFYFRYRGWLGKARKKAPHDQGGGHSMMSVLGLLEMALVGMALAVGMLVANLVSSPRREL